MWVQDASSLKVKLIISIFFVFQFQRVQNSTLFYVVGADNAETLRNLSRRISTNTGQRLVILTSKAPLPCANLDDRVNAAIKIAMSGRYDVNSKVMNLANFAQAEEFKRQGLFITISKANVLRTVVQVISENTPDLVALNLRENKMNFLEALRPLAEKCPSLKALDLSKNKVRWKNLKTLSSWTNFFVCLQIHVFAEIKNLSNLDLIELVLEGNPFIDDFPSHATYIRFVLPFLSFFSFCCCCVWLLLASFMAARTPSNVSFSYWKDRSFLR